VRKPAFTKSYATVATRYGSVDTALRAGGRARALPDGIAHFLEHKVFETPQGDAFDLFAARGAPANAFTSFASTRYLFGTSTLYPENLRILLDMVLDLQVTDAGVEKEKDIIGQEIAGYDDDPEWRIYFGALQGMYRRHPIRIDIAGTKRSIAGIDAGLLRAVHAAYYHPRLMVLAAVSPEPVATTLAAVEERVEPRRFPPAAGRRGPAPRESRRARRRAVRTVLPVARPKVLLASKDVPPARPGKAQLRQEQASAVALDCLFGNSGSIYLKLYEEGLVDDSFAYSYNTDAGCAFAMVGGETDDPAKLRRALEREVGAALARGIDADSFERVRNKALGGYAREFNSPERIAHLLVDHHLRGTTVADTREVLFSLSRAEVDRRLRDMLRPEGRCYSVVVPGKGNGAAR
jgi:predicted Zn-dependent peptidase